MSVHSTLALQLLVLISTCSTAATLALVTEEYPPYNMSSTKGEISGISTDIVRELMKAAAYKYQINIYPWQRAILMARKQADTCVFSMSRTAERESQYKWIGPLLSNDWALFALKATKQPTTLTEVQTTRIGSYQGDAIVDYLQSRNFKVDVAPSDDVNPKKLLSGHIDYWATGKLIGAYILKKQEILNIEPVLTFNRTEMYLACNTGIADTEVTRLNLLLSELKAQGLIKRIYDLHGYPDSKPDAEKTGKITK